MRWILMAASAVLAVEAPASAQERQPNSYQFQELSPGTFDRLEVSGPFKVAVLVRAGPARVQLTGPPALLADTIATADGKTLTIRFREGARWSWNQGSGVNIVVSTPMLVSGRVHGAAQVDIHQVRGDAFSAETDGAGTIAIHALDAARVQFATGGAGGITAEGSARQGTYAARGSGSIDAKRLRVESATIAVGGSGSVYADVSRTAAVSVAGDGRVDVVGGATCVKQPAASAQIECR